MQIKYKRFGLLYGLLKVLVPISFFYYYKKIKIINQSKIPKKTPIIFTSNHQNTLIDPFVIGIYSYRLTGFLARASAFKNPLAAKILKSLKIMPVYRPRDGMENLNKNDEIFKACFEVLSNRQSFAMFPEGSHDRTRHLRLFKKGFTRIALGAVEESNYNLKVKIFPTGINYSDHLYQGGDLLVIFGNPIEVSDYNELYKQNQAKAVNDLKNEVHHKIKELMIHIEDMEHYDMIDSLREIYRYEMLKRLNLKRDKLYHEFKADKKTIEIIENYNKEHKEETNILDNKVKEYKQSLKELKLKEKVFVKINNFFTVSLNSLLLIILCPVFVFSFFNSFIPYFFIRYVIKNKVHDDHFYSAFKSAIGMFLYPVFYLIITIPVFIIFGFIIGIIYYFSLFIATRIALFSRQLFRNTILQWNFLFSKHTKSNSFQNLLAQRKEIIRIMDEMVEINIGKH
jgi:1-acyl-sn-glycerol-3-phosphate acyltransferase